MNKYGRSHLIVHDTDQMTCLKLSGNVKGTLWNNKRQVTSKFHHGKFQTENSFHLYRLLNNSSSLVDRNKVILIRVI